MITVVTGNDPFLILEEKRLLQSAFLAKDQSGQVISFDFEENKDPKQIRNIFELCEDDLFATPKLFFIGYLSALDEELQNVFFRELELRHSEGSFVIFEPNGFKKSDLWYKKMKELKGVTFLEKNKPSDLEQRKIFQQKMKTESIVVEPRAEMLFLSRTRGNSAKFFSELEKIITYKNGGGKVMENEIEMLLEPVLEDTAFLAMDALASGDRARALILIRLAHLWKKDALPLLGLCAWKVRQLIILRQAFDTGATGSDAIARLTGISPYLVGKERRAIEAFTLTRLKKAHGLLVEYDRDIKQGQIDPGLALDFFVWKM